MVYTEIFQRCKGYNFYKIYDESTADISSMCWSPHCVKYGYKLGTCFTLSMLTFHRKLTLCYFIVRRASQTLGQH